MRMPDYIDFEQLCEAAAVAHPSNALYCLADHAGMPGLHRELLRFGLPWASLFQDSPEQSALAAAPLLFPLLADDERANHRFLQWLAAHGSYTSSILILSSPETLDVLRTRLARRMHARVSDDMDVLLRYFDPRVFESLVAVLDDGQRNDFLAPADCWWYPNRSGELLCQEARHAEGKGDAPLQLSAKQEFALLDASEIDQVAAQLQSMLPDAYLGMGVVERISFLRHHMKAARVAGIEASHEVALYCGLALLHGEAFAQVSPWRELLLEVRKGSTGLADAVAALEA